jgi:diguanylate cyclase (GGDEF)-like protein
MTDTRYIAASDLNSNQRLNDLVHAACPSVLCHVPGVTPSTEELRMATLLIIADPTKEVQPLLEDPSLPASTPVLFLCTGDSFPPLFRQYQDRRLLDYLFCPTFLDAFLHRIAFLGQVQKISAEYHANATTLSRQLDALATRDGLTGLFNRRHLTTNLAALMETARTTGQDLALLLFNIDFFNKVNTLSGQQFGDFILNEMAARLTTATRNADTSCYRFSGEDFVVLLPGTGLAEACIKAEKIRRACSDKPFTFGQKSQHITVSMGVASLKDHKPLSHDDFITMAETALFVAKAQGRDRLQIFSADPLPGAISSRRSLDFLKQLGLPDQHIETFQNAITLYNSFRSLLHNDLVKKPGQLSRTERKTMEDLPFKLTELTDMFDYFCQERNILLCYGERFDGTGHPRGLAGDEIPLGARIFNIIDAVAAMNSERPYRRKLTPGEIISELKMEAGKQFDPFLVLQVLMVIEKNHLLNLERQVIEGVRNELLNTFPELKS